MRIGIAALMHESNTWVTTPTSLDQFREDLFLTGDDIRRQLAASHHEIGGFFEGLGSRLGNVDFEAVPLAAFRATPSGMLKSGVLDSLIDLLLDRLARAGNIDGLLLAAHGAAVAEDHLDADGYWLHRVRNSLPRDVPIVATLDAHANLSHAMVEACDAFVGYRTNPHLDQRARGIEAAAILMQSVTKQIRPTMAAAFPRMIINIERQCTSEPHLQAIYDFADQQRLCKGVISNSILLGFPYADVPEMGTATLVVTDGDPVLAQQLAEELSSKLWNARDSMRGELIDVDEALMHLRVTTSERVCLLDMGDNVGGGSAADGTFLLHALHRAKIGPSCMCLWDPVAVRECMAGGVGSERTLELGGHTDELHGTPCTLKVLVQSLHSGQFSEHQPRHGGIVHFDQGPTAVVRSIDSPLTLVLTSRRMVPFSLQQLRSCDLDPRAFRVLVAKGVHAPLAAYREVCDTFLRINTPGSTCADLKKIPFRRRRIPMFPWEDE